MYDTQARADRRAGNGGGADPRAAMHASPHLLTERDVCAILAISRTKLRSLALEPRHIGRSVRYPGAPAKMPASPWGISRRAPKIGEHDAEVLG